MGLSQGEESRHPALDFAVQGKWSTVSAALAGAFGLPEALFHPVLTTGQRLADPLLTAL